ncbi:hypothetical protein PSPO_a1366 [Pseudoalteromonas spongiae UST010723-006]|nr:hypothetical protein PSPO_a1366 [Pseudoalteromonas spongiae UST010723-006]
MEASTLSPIDVPNNSVLPVQRYLLQFKNSLRHFENRAV